MIFRDLQDLQSFAPLRSQNFRKKRVTILAVLNDYSKLFIQNFALFKSKVRFFVKFLMKFCRNFTNMLRMSRIFNFLKKKGPNFSKNPWKFRKCSNYSENYSKLFSRVPRKHPSFLSASTISPSLPAEGNCWVVYNINVVRIYLWTRSARLLNVPILICRKSSGSWESGELRTRREEQRSVAES